MIISRTPLRISFAGGGTDLRPFYEIAPGAIIGTTINKYIYVAVNHPLDETIRVSYWKTEMVNSVGEIEHAIVRTALQTMGLTNSIDIVSIADIPAGTGLGSSGSFTVGLLNALHAYKSVFAPKETLAKGACHIEIDLLKAPIGKQDQYLSAYGGLQYIQFNPDESVSVEPVVCKLAVQRDLEGNLMLFYTGQTRAADMILARQHRETKETQKFQLLCQMRDMAHQMRLVLTEGKDLKNFGRLLHEEWLCKRELTDGITNDMIDRYYSLALNAGALGGKISGAGGGGFLLIYCEKDKQPKVREALKNLKEVKFSFESQGSTIITVS